MTQSVLLGRRLGGKAYLLATTAVSSGGGGTASVSFTRTNYGSSTSPGFKRRGVWFAKGEVPAGSIPTISGIASQFYRPRFWLDGSLQSAVMVTRDGSYAPSETRSYTITPTTGSYAQTGSRTLAQALTGRSLVVTVSGVQKTDGNITATYGSGSFSATLGSLANVKKIAGGSVVNVWNVGGFATDTGTGTPDAHLWVNATIWEYLNADGSQALLQVGAWLSQHQWAVSGKYSLIYTAALKDGSTTIVTANTTSTTPHVYHAQVPLCINDGSNLAGTAPFIGTAPPTLHDTIDTAHLFSTGLVAHFDTTITPQSTTTIPTYVPGANTTAAMADPNSGDGHRLAIDGTGDYLGRGMLTNPDSDAIIRGTAAAYARARIHALAALSFPGHYRSPANTPMALIMAPKAPSYYDCTADGMPTPADAYADYRNSTAHNAGFVVPAGTNPSGIPGWQGAWGLSDNSSHSVNYGYFMALYEGDEWLREATIDLGMYLAHQSIYGYSNGRGLLWAGESDYSSLNIPTTTWSGLLGQWVPDNSRGMAWSQLILAQMTAMTASDHVAFNYVNKLVAHNGDWIQQSMLYLPDDHKAAGVWTPVSQLGNPGLEVGFFYALKSLCSYQCYLITEDIRWKNLGDHAFTFTKDIASAGRWYQFEFYKLLDRMRHGGWANGANPIRLPHTMPWLNFDSRPMPNTPGAGCFVTASTGRVSVQCCYFNAENSVLPVTNGDMVVFTAAQQDASGGTIPPGFSEGQVAYVRDVANPTPNWNPYASSPTPTTFRLSSQPDLSDVLTVLSDSPCNLAWSPQAAGLYTVAQDPPFIPNADNYAAMHIANIHMARRIGTATVALRDAAKTFAAPMDFGKRTAFALTS